MSRILTGTRFLIVVPILSLALAATVFFVFGDFSPSTDLAKLITVFYSLNGVVMLLMLFDVTRRVRGWYLGSPAAEEGSEST